jgi:hypothetical protein
MKQKMKCPRMGLWLLLVLLMAPAAVVAQADSVPLLVIKPRLDPRKMKLTPAQMDGEAKTMGVNKIKKGHHTFAVVVNGDTIPLIYLRDVNVYSSGMLLTAKEIKKNSKLIRNVRLMLPYAREAKRRLDVLETEIANLPKKQRKAAIKKAEQDLKDQYQGELEKFTFSQGLVLIKLIDRETNRTAYTLVGDLRGTFRAGLYQTFARLFGYNLKTKFDPEHDSKDELINRIVISIERGQL